jgi:mediator of replication checkpoint protein 1
MSAPITPSKTFAGNDATISSPNSSVGATPTQLTPRSKVKAMLATFGDSDDDDLPATVKNDAISEDTEIRVAGRMEMDEQTRQIKENKDEAMEGYTEEPSNSQLAQQFLLSSSQNGSSPPPETAEPEGAYERVRRELMNARSSPTKAIDKSPTLPRGFGAESDSDASEIAHKPRGKMAARMAAAVEKDTGNESEDDESDAPIIRKRVARRSSPQAQSNASSPASTPRQSSSLFVSGDTPQKAVTSFSISGDTLQRSAMDKDTPQLDNSDSDADFPSNSQTDSRFKALVERKKQERLAKQAEQDAKKAARALVEKELTLDDSEDDASDNGGRLTQKTREPKTARKASKKALEEMRREQQRIARGMQLGHEARTRKKITKQSLFARFNFKPANAPVDDDAARPKENISSSTTASGDEGHHTPPTSPPSLEDLNKSAKIAEPTSTAMADGRPEMESDEELDDYMTRLDEYAARRDEEIARSSQHPVVSPTAILNTDQHIHEASVATLQETKPIQPVQAELRKITFSKDQLKSMAAKMAADDSDDGLDIVMPRKEKKYAIFDRTPKKGDHQVESYHALRMLAQLDSPGKTGISVNNKTGKLNARSMNPTELSVSMMSKARAQAKMEREEKLQELRDRGIIVQSAEDRAKEMEEVEDIVARAREQADEIMKREKAQAKKERKANGETMLDDSSDEEDGDWGDDEAALSGSDEEMEEADGEGDSEVEEPDDVDPDARNESGDDAEVADSNPLNPFIEAEAEEDDEDEDEEARPIPGRRSYKTIISDDDDDDNISVMETPVIKAVPFVARSETKSVSKSATKPLFTSMGVPKLGLTQMFAATMSDTQQTQDFPATAPQMLEDQTEQLEEQEEDSMAFLRNLPIPSMPGFTPTQSFLADDTQDTYVVRDSQQTSESGPAIDLNFAQSQVGIDWDSIPRDNGLPSATQATDFPEPSQDIGFDKSSPALVQRFIETPAKQPETSTIETVLVDADVEPESPLMKKKGRLVRKLLVASFSDDDNSDRDEANSEAEADNDNVETPAPPSSTVFDIMRKASKEKKAAKAAAKAAAAVKYNRERSDAKGMVEEDAEESDDEWAGLGGADDDGTALYGDEAALEAMIEEGDVEMDERKLAAFVADRERAADEIMVERLFKDVTTGNLRRKRGNGAGDLDLSDSEDEQQQARLKRRRREEAKMRKALLENEDIGKIGKSIFY